MKILVTGAAGFIASRIMATLSARGDEVVGLDSVPPKLNLDIFGKANKIVHLACKNFIGSQVPDSRVQPFRCFAEYSGENKPAFRNGGNRQTGIQETALAA